MKNSTFKEPTESVYVLNSVTKIYGKGRLAVKAPGAKWGAEEVDYIATPGSINVITVYITPTLANGLKDIIAELYLPKPLTGLDGGSIVKTSYMEFVPKGQILPLTFKVIVPLNTPEGNYTFRLKIKYTILAPLPEERKWEVEFNLPISGRTYVYTELLTEKLEKGKVQNINFNVVYVGNEPVELNIDFQSDALSILDYEPKAPILTDKPGSFEASAKVYCPPDVQVNGLPITQLHTRPCKLRVRTLKRT